MKPVIEPDIHATLLEALQEAADGLSEARSGFVRIGLSDAATVVAKREDAARAAIARATGEAPEQATPAQLATQGEYFEEDAG